MSDETPATVSPLAEADPLSLDELFNRVNRKLILGVPERLTNADVDPMCAMLRAKRMEFLSEQDRLGRAPTAPRKAKPKSVAEAVAVTISEDDL